MDRLFLLDALVLIPYIQTRSHMKTHRRILILADIEGSSACCDYESTTFMGDGWPDACLGMTRDVDAVVTALFKAGAEHIYVKDFHRTAYNLIREQLNPKAILLSGYKKGPVPGIGLPGDATGLVMLGMHAPSGSNGFLAHTLTSRILKLEVNGELMSEAQFFSASLGRFNLIPLFYSGCPVACEDANKQLPSLSCFPIQMTDRLTEPARQKWRSELADHAVRAVCRGNGRPYLPDGPFLAVVTLDPSRCNIPKMAGHWGFNRQADTITIRTDTIHELYDALIRLVYFSPVTLKLMPVLLPLYNFWGWLGLVWAKRQIRG